MKPVICILAVIVILFVVGGCSAASFSEVYSLSTDVTVSIASEVPNENLEVFLVDFPEANAPILDMILIDGETPFIDRFEDTVNLTFGEDIPIVSEVLTYGIENYNKNCGLVMLTFKFQTDYSERTVLAAIGTPDDETMYEWYLPLTYVRDGNIIIVMIDDLFDFIHEDELILVVLSS